VNFDFFMENPPSGQKRKLEFSSFKWSSFLEAGQPTA
jgi:hypothetical protein